VLVPILVNTLLLVLLIAATFHWLAPFISQWTAHLQYWGPDAGIFRSLIGLLASLARIMAAVLLLGVDTLVLLLFGQVIASPFLDLLSEKVEALILDRPAPRFQVQRMFHSVWVSLSDLLGGLAFMLAVNIPIFLLSLTVVAAVPAAVAGFVASALLLTHEFVGLSLARRFVNYRGRWKVVRQNTWAAIGFGSTAMVLVMVPGVNLLLLPLAAVGGTMMYCDLLQSGRIDLAPNPISQ
jgi:CysZ protein